MVEIKRDTRTPMTFERLMRLGQVAHAQGDDRTAHEYWRQAALLEPDNEQVWTALMWVLDEDEDRKTCLKNILTINPHNVQAQQMLDDLIGETQPQVKNETVIADVDPDTEPGINYLRVLILGSILGIGGAISIVLLQMLLNQL